MDLTDANDKMKASRLRCDCAECRGQDMEELL